MNNLEPKVIDINLNGKIVGDYHRLNKAFLDANTGDEIRIRGERKGFVLGKSVIGQWGEEIIIVRSYENGEEREEMLTKRSHPILHRELSEFVQNSYQTIKQKYGVKK